MKGNKKYISTRYMDENGCVLCLNIPNPDGYIRTTYGEGNNKLKMLHVLEWEAINGVKPEGMELNHKCKNRGCCNVEHLELIDGGAHATLTNVERVGYEMYRFSDEDIAYMYRKIKYELHSINYICKQFGIKRSTMSSIMNKRSRVLVTDAVDKIFKIIEE